MRPPDSMTLKEFDALLRERHPEWSAGGYVAPVIKLILKEACVLGTNPTLGQIRDTFKSRRPFVSEDFRLMRAFNAGIGPMKIEVFKKILVKYDLGKIEE